MLLRDLSVNGVPRRLIDTVAATGLRELYPPQVLAIEAGLLAGNGSLVVAAPTASGKTLIAEMAALKLFFEGAGKTVYTVPLRALAREKYEDLSKKYTPAGIKVAQSTGDFDREDPWLRQADLIVTTNEKFDSLLRHRAPWVTSVGLLIADEVHLLGDARRGPTLEILLTRLKREMPTLRIIALSATVPNAAEVARWLEARVVTSEWRPVPLREGVFFDGAVIFNDGTVTWVPEETGVDAVDLAEATVREGGQALIFVNTRRSAEATAARAAKIVSGFLNAGDRKILGETAGALMSAASEPARVSLTIADLVQQGVAFHHAGMLSSQRKLIENAFRENRIKCLAATTTLAMGLNLPSRRVIIRDWRRFEAGAGMVPLPVMEIKQMSGRAGRPGFDDYGEAVLVAGSKRDERLLFERYIKGMPEPVRSRLGSETALRTHVLTAVAAGFAPTRDDLDRFLGGTLFGLQEGADAVPSLSGEVLRFLVKEGLVSGAGQLAATRFGRRISELYIDPLSGIMLRESLSTDIEKTTFGLLHMVARTPDMMKLPVRDSEIDNVLALFADHEESLLLAEKRAVPSEGMLSEIKTAALVAEWIEESSEDRMTRLFGVGPGDIHTAVELCNWLLYAAQEIAKILKYGDAQDILRSLRDRVRYGVRQELLPLVAFRGIGRVRARNLFDAGYRGTKEIRAASVEALEKVPAIGRAVAEDIKKQVAPDAAA